MNGWLLIKLYFGIRPHGEVVQNPLFNNEDRAEGESDNEEEGYLDMDSADDGDDGGDDDGDNSKAGNPTLRRPPRTRDPALGDALNRETDTKNKLIKVLFGIFEFCLDVDT